MRGVREMIQTEEYIDDLFIRGDYSCSYQGLSECCMLMGDKA